MKIAKIINEVIIWQRKICVFLAMAIFLLLSFAEIYAAENREAQPARTKPLNSQNLTKQQKQNDSKISNDAVKMFIKKVEIYGTIAKPQAIFIIQATDPKVEGLKINRHFFDHIFRNVEKSSIKRVRKKQAQNKDHIEW